MAFAVDTLNGIIGLIRCAVNLNQCNRTIIYKRITLEYTAGSIRDGIFHGLTTRTNDEITLIQILFRHRDEAIPIWHSCDRDSRCCFSFDALMKFTTFDGFFSMIRNTIIRRSKNRCVCLFIF